MRRVRIGCSGWSYEHWKGVLYEPDASSAGWLARYAEVFDTVEVNATFYRLPARATVARWADGTPPGFCFAVKASRYATHVKRLRDTGSTYPRLVERIQPLGDAGKLGPILWQLPETFHRDDPRLERALEELGPGRHAFEFRHASWFAPEVYTLLRRHDAALVVAHSARRDLPDAPQTAGWGYVRLHHGSRGRRGNYSERELEEWASRIRALRGDVYVFLNNDWEGFAVENALRLRELLADVATEPGGRSPP